MKLKTERSHPARVLYEVDPRVGRDREPVEADRTHTEARINVAQRKYPTGRLPSFRVGLDTFWN